ncbi:MAG: hypothetical protein KGH59_00315 [Candidatus Micrarchaeota archaeon]|nr:hypothetical protein [Candidatus Micrarchaeota archaeon]MDE1804217.1 hypothetical protein [Candidatus Micrarchaeota archaeon]MDE1846673.1 hypothetical protein [Candidatus Micrarchaeota archaeon]
MRKTYLIFAFAMLLTSNMAHAQWVPAWMLPNTIASGGFIGGTEAYFKYTEAYKCSPPNSQLFTNSTELLASLNYTQCSFGVPGNAVGADQQWLLIPAYAGMSSFGFNSSFQGFPLYNGTVVVTHCGVGGTASSCPDHPQSIYSPLFSGLEKSVGIAKGAFGLPEGVLPMPAHDYVIDDYDKFADVDWYTIAVYVFDPNIMPNATTGACMQVVPSNLTSPTANCLTSIGAIQRAMTNSSSSVAAGNSRNPIWRFMGNPTMQIAVPGNPTVAEINNSNSNLRVPYAVRNYSYYHIPLNNPPPSTEVILVVIAAGAAIVAITLRLFEYHRRR